MSKKVISLFGAAAKEVFIESGFPSIVIEEDDCQRIEYDVLANVGITGDLQGYLLIKCDIQSANNFVSKMMERFNIEIGEDEFGPLHRETIGELVNQISGRAGMHLASENLDCHITPPTVFVGTQVSISLNEPEESVSYKISDDFGDLFLFVGIKKS